MRKCVLQNSAIAEVVSRMGHGDSLCVGDAGLPIPQNVKRIDLAVRAGLPAMLDVAESVASELQIERVILAEELKNQQGVYHQEVLSLIDEIAAAQSSDIAIDYVNHGEFKAKSAECRAVVRTGEFTPYANIIFIAGTTF
ncbi:D-ribose pyranase [Polycladidibacter stylochi]|uniref:D-ribose pyranase n=1 Tax=Polycladidibacter stylochi TaxID=1807766 RepID=UPI00082B5389|nr:D-ribose pyranase [Pseudovibrio stylochi]